MRIWIRLQLSFKYVTKRVNICHVAGMVEFRDALTGLIDEFGQDAADQPDLPPSHVIGSRRSKQVIPKHRYQIIPPNFRFELKKGNTSKNSNCHTEKSENICGRNFLDMKMTFNCCLLS